MIKTFILNFNSNCHRLTSLNSPINLSHIELSLNSVFLSRFKLYKLNNSIICLINNKLIFFYSSIFFWKKIASIAVRIPFIVISILSFRRKSIWNLIFFYYQNSFYEPFIIVVNFFILSGI